MGRSFATSRLKNSSAVVKLATSPRRMTSPTRTRRTPACTKVRVHAVRASESHWADLPVRSLEPISAYTMSGRYCNIHGVQAFRSSMRAPGWHRQRKRISDSFRPKLCVAGLDFMNCWRRFPKECPTKTVVRGMMIE